MDSKIMVRVLKRPKSMEQDQIEEVTMIAWVLIHLNNNKIVNHLSIKACALETAQRKHTIPLPPLKHFHVTSMERVLLSVTALGPSLSLRRDQQRLTTLTPNPDITTTLDQNLNKKLSNHNHSIPEI